MEDNSPTLIAAMAGQCADTIRGSHELVSTLPDALQSRHLLWMCDKIQRNPAGFPDTKLHRWLGFIQAAILANRMLELDDVKAMFNKIKRSFHLNDGDDQDLMDHLNLDNSFTFEIGGQG
jgi:hypothetical protein